MAKSSAALAASMVFFLTCVAGDRAHASDEAAAQSMFDAAARSWSLATTQPPAAAAGGAQTAKIDLLREVDATLRRIVERFPATRLATRLSSGDVVGDLSMARTSLAIEHAIGESCDP
jgi:hypothetical protein